MLSYSEQMRCNLEIGRWLREKSRYNAPIFLDNSESITTIEQELVNTDQIFLSRVVRGAPLQVN